MPKKKSNILIAGLGNVLLRDDGVGVHAIRELQRHSIKDATAVEVGCAIFDVLPLLDSAAKILLIDAMQVGGTPGTIYSCGLRDLEMQPAKGSLHELSLINALQVFVRPSPREIRLTLGSASYIRITNFRGGRIDRGGIISLCLG
ncbi:MAG: hydrogenase maturation protease [Deltaproteobacteria bacterium]|nr:hydrogenase maturation protease [Deltaproteobacteria bacterium]